MKNFLLIILLAVICISASVVTKNIFVPAIPKNVVIFTEYRSNAKIKMINYAKLGYVTKVVTINSNGDVFVVMEKY